MGSRIVTLKCGTNYSFKLRAHNKSGWGEDSSVVAHTTVSTGLAPWPISSIMLTYVNTSPTTLIGFGTWVLIGSDTLAGATVYVWRRSA